MDNTVQIVKPRDPGLHPVAELNGGGLVVSRFVYASKPHVPDYVVRTGVTTPDEVARVTTA